MLERLNSLEEKLDSLLKRLVSLKQERDDQVEEARKLKSQLDKIKKGKSGAPGAADRDKETHKDVGDEEYRDQLRKSEEEKKLLKKKIEFLEKELENKNALEEETMGKLRDIITRIDALEAEIGELEN